MHNYFIFRNYRSSENHQGYKTFKRRTLFFLAFNTFRRVTNKANNNSFCYSHLVNTKSLELKLHLFVVLINYNKYLIRIDKHIIPDKPLTISTPCYTITDTQVNAQ